MSTTAPTRLDAAAAPARAWYRDLTPAQWFVLLVASLGWLFDTMDQQLFNLARRPAITELLRVGAAGDPSATAPSTSTAATPRRSS